MKPKTNSRYIVLGLAGVVGLAMAAAAYATYIKVAPATIQGAHNVSVLDGSMSSKVVAVVNGHDIYMSELARDMSQGIDRAVAVDRYINKVLVADLARAAYENDAKDALRIAERDVLSQLYINKKSVALRAGIADAVVKAYYDANIKAEDYTSYKVKFLIADNEKDAGEVIGSITAGKTKEVESRFKTFKEGSDEFMTAAQLPYNMGSVVRGLKKGEYSRAMVVRNGYFILYLEDSKINPKPDLAKIGDEIRNFLIGKQLDEELAAVRAAAKIELH